MGEEMRVISTTFGAAAVLLWATISTACAQSVELIPFEIMTVTTQQFLIGGKDGKPATIAGELRFPKLGSEKVAAVILMEGAGGIGRTLSNGWRRLTVLALPALCRTATQVVA
jgi:hypothetical protein